MLQLISGRSITLKQFKPLFGNSYRISFGSRRDRLTRYQIILQLSHLTTANSSTVFHDSTRPPSKTSGHCLENDAGSQLEDADTATSSTMVERISPYSNVDPFTTPKTRTRLTSKNLGHCLECHNGSHSENRERAASSKLIRKSIRQRIW